MFRGVHVWMLRKLFALTVKLGNWGQACHEYADRIGGFIDHRAARLGLEVTEVTGA